MRNAWVSALVAGAIVVAAYWGASRPPTVDTPPSANPSLTLPERWVPPPAEQPSVQETPATSPVTIRLPRLFATSFRDGKNLALLGRDGEQKLLAEGDSWTDFTVMRIESERVLLALEGGGTRWVERVQGQVFYAPSNATPLPPTPTPHPELSGTDFRAELQRAIERSEIETSPDGSGLRFKPKGLAKTLGLDDEEVLTMANGHPLQTTADLKLLDPNLCPDGRLNLVVSRQGQSRELTFQFR